MGRLIGGGLDALLRRLTSTGFRRGLSGETWAWLVLALAALVLRRARRPEHRVTTLVLSPGDRYEVGVFRPGELDESAAS